jgi:hypothetical protein
MKSKILLLTLSLFLAASIKTYSQENSLFIPSKIKKLYDGKTRTLAGKPGAGYWQNSADYKIEAELYDDTREVVGKQTITYYNNSPDTLDKIVIHLLQDIYKSGNARDWNISKSALHDGVNIEKFKIDGTLYELDTMGYRYGTNLIIDNLPNSVKPNTSITFEMEWDILIPEVSKIRMGKYGEHDYFIAYWYPKIAVYDDVYGWDKLSYTGRTEFYSDNNNYDVKIILPGDYLVWATGTLQNPKQVLSENTFKRFEEALTSDEVVRIVREKDYRNLDVTADNGENIWRFAATGVPDFSFACSDRYLWDGVSAVVDEAGTRVFTDAAYAPGTVNYENAAMVSKRCIEYLSTQMPAVPFPFPNMTTFCNGNRGGGMETPMMANNGAPKDTNSFHTLLLHEIAHSYFPFYVYTNEKRYAWMDESWATYFPRQYSEIFLNEYDHLNYVKRYLRGYQSSGEQDLPLIIPSNNLTGSVLGINSYGKSYLAMFELQKYLGDELFIKALKEYINRWSRKHPLPYDFFYTFNDVIGEDLTWFWKAWLYDFGIADYALEKNDSKELVLVKVGELPASISVEVNYDDGTSDLVSVGLKEWKDGSTKKVLSTRLDKKIKSAQIKSEDTFDFNSKNNSIIFYN